MKAKKITVKNLKIKSKTPRTTTIHGATKIQDPAARDTTTDGDCASVLGLPVDR